LSQKLAQKLAATGRRRYAAANQTGGIDDGNEAQIGP
jgi:hypothetical protein